MRRWRTKDVVALAKQNAELVAQALERAQRDKHSGLPSGHGDGRGTANDGGGAYSGTEMLAISGQVSKDSVRKALRDLHASLAKTHHLAESLLRIPESDRQKYLLPAGAGVCANPHCDRFCPGGPDRRRSGRCEACYRYRLEHKGEERPPHLCRDQREDVA